MNEQRWVAVVDDDESLRMSLVRVFRCVDIDARGFASAEAFLELEDDSEPTCLVLDIHLGLGLNGFELQERLESEGRAPPIIFISGHARPPVDVSADFLRKPFCTDQLIALVRHHLLGELTAARTRSAVAESRD